MLQTCGVWTYPSPKLWARKLMSTTLFDKFVRQPKRFWFVVILLFSPVPFYWLGAPKTFEAHVRWHATALQMLGLWLVYKGLMETAERFKVPTPWAKAKALLDSLNPLKKPEPVHRTFSVGTGAFHTQSGSVTMSVQRANPTDTQRIEELERLLKDFKADVERVHQANTQKFKQLDKQVSGLAVELGGQIEEVRTVMKAQTAGGLGDSFMGLAWVAFGTLLGGLASDLPGWLGVL